MLKLVTGKIPQSFLPFRRSYFAEAQRIVNMANLLRKDNNYTPAVPKLAATVLICRELDVPRNGFDYEVLFVKRKATARFMAGFHVFPGGITEKTDSLPDNHPLLPYPLPEVLKDTEKRTLRFAAVREVFEESNVLLCDPPIGPEQLATWRPIVLKDFSAFETMCKELLCKPSWDSLYEWTHWITPEAEKYRYDTHFYLIPIPKSRKLDACHDNFETTQHDWITPGEVLEQYEARNILLAPPTWITIVELASYQSLKKLTQIAQKGRDMEPVVPKFLMKMAEGGESTIHLCLPGDKDSENPVNDSLLRRLVITPGKSYRFISSLPETKAWQSVESLRSRM